MKIIALLINIQYFLIYCKYFVYFTLFLNVLLINTLFYKVTNSYSNFLAIALYKTINLNGCVLIKFIQWILSNIELLDLNVNKFII